MQSQFNSSKDFNLLEDEVSFKDLGLTLWGYFPYETARIDNTHDAVWIPMELMPARMFTKSGWRYFDIDNLV